MAESCDTKVGTSISPGEAISGLLSGKVEWKAEREILIASAASAVLLLAILGFAYFSVWAKIPKFEENILPLLAMGAVSVVAIVGTGVHFDAYRKPVSCMIGMMEGMTFGMMAGFIFGALFGATNGMFWGSILGLAVGCAIGAWTGRCCGVMGIMEGLMAGVMSGTMGAMLSVMLLAEPLPIFMAVLVASCLLILAALWYMNVQELGNLGERKRAAAWQIAAISVVGFAILVAIMIYGPKSGPVWGA